MRKFKFVLVILVSFILAACGGGSDIPAKPKFTSQVSFGDSLSDVGTYNVGEVAAAGGGQFSINGPNANGKAANGNNIVNWTEVMAINLGLPAPCPAVTGLIDGTGLLSGTNVTPVTHAGCNGYAQGGARVTAVNGIHNLLNNPLGPTLGGHELTYPLVTQISNYLAANGGSFSGTEVVSVVIGANDLSYQLQVLVGGATLTGNAAAAAELATLTSGSQAAATAIGAQIQLDIASGACVPADAQASNCVTPAVTTLVTAAGTNAANAYLGAHAPAAVGEMATAATELVGYVNTQILGKGAKYVIVANMGDFASIPATAAYSASQKVLITTMINAFNDTLSAGVSGNANVLYFDFYKSSKDEITNPAKYGLDNATTPACNNANGRALYCNSSTLIAGVTVDSHYLFADDQHPTPYGYSLIAQGVLQAMTAKGWY
jgi:phospholipase/lecithinase/hemolysin